MDCVVGPPQSEPVVGRTVLAVMDLVADEATGTVRPGAACGSDSRRQGRKPMATTEGTVKRTYDDYRARADDERYELLNGELMMVPAPNIKHQSILLTLGSELRRFVQEHELGEVFVAPVDVVLSDTDVVQPDVLFISRAREDRITDENVRGAPDLVIEILSPSTADRDLGYKHELYGRRGVLEYWVVDPVAETVAVHRQHDGRLEPAGTFGRRDRLGTALLEGLQLDLGDILAR